MRRADLAPLALVGHRHILGVNRIQENCMGHYRANPAAVHDLVREPRRRSRHAAGEYLDLFPGAIHGRTAEQ
jgi:hypothetical protein